MSKNKGHKIPILSFFSGGGFMDMGFEQAGFEVVWTNEFDKTFAELHAAGMTSWRISQGNRVKAEIFNTKSITAIKSEEIVFEAFSSGKPKHIGIIGGHRYPKSLYFVPIILPCSHTIISARKQSIFFNIYCRKSTTKVNSFVSDASGQLTVDN